MAQEEITNTDAPEEEDNGLYPYWTPVHEAEPNELHMKLLREVAGRFDIEFHSAPVFARYGDPIGSLDIAIDRLQGEACCVWAHGPTEEEDAAFDAVWVPVGEDMDATLRSAVAAMEAVGIMW
ncbi:hypothetical protein DTW90_22935 [Neorhizobium sp. P12A]|uniref:hypothetical protein n=1 Tax=Neorhizobium sp. P12A TaxID=2268027 RepID=UPI0011EBD1B9|nr:hypothetical protein [Neorhizobium sp. P12A]KAA0695423.1 hypothetical protein DTW90_22935 [Neorhizobium sp. P12A]